jgi:hypothetical protein
MYSVELYTVSGLDKRVVPIIGESDAEFDRYVHSAGVSPPLMVCGMMGTDVSILVYLVSIDYCLVSGRMQPLSWASPTSSTAASMLKVESGSFFSSGRKSGEMTIVGEAKDISFVVLSVYVIRTYTWTL